MPSEFEHSAAFDDGVTTLPENTQRLYEALAHDGAAWRVGAAPEIDRLQARLQASVAEMDAVYTSEKARPTAPALKEVSAPHNLPIRLPENAPSPARFGRARGWAATFLAAAVVVAFVGVYALSSTHRPGASMRPTATGAATTTTEETHGSGFQPISALDDSAEFDANEIPAIAPSDPRVVYETMARGMQQHLPASMRATSDGGKTWRALAMPVAADHIGELSIGVSPVNPRTVFLSLFDTTPADCPANRLITETEGPGQFCQLQFTSLDGGASWKAAQLPLANGKTPGVLLTSLNSGLVMPADSNSSRVVGSRLFAIFSCVNYTVDCSRLVTSADGGVSWTFADAPMLASGAAAVCDFTTTADGASLVAVTAPKSCGWDDQGAHMLWRSGDAGAHWSKVSQLTTPNERGMLSTRNLATGAALLYVASPQTTQTIKDKGGYPRLVFSQSPADITASADGGATWQHAPTAGIPSGHVVFSQAGLFGTLSDGSVVVDVISTSQGGALDSDNFSGSDLYVWRAGDAAWRLIGSVPREIDGLVIVPSKQGPADTLYAVLVNRNNTGTFTFIKETVS